jgi:hypothetical protein
VGVAAAVDIVAVGEVEERVESLALGLELSLPLVVVVVVVVG